MRFARTPPIIEVSIVAKGALVKETVNYDTEIKTINLGSPGEGESRVKSRRRKSGVVESR